MIAVTLQLGRAAPVGFPTCKTSVSLHALNKCSFPGKQTSSAGGVFSCPDLAEAAGSACRMVSIISLVGLRPKGASTGTDSPASAIGPELPHKSLMYPNVTASREAHF
jgi:hypothetical protein